MNRTGESRQSNEFPTDQDLPNGALPLDLSGATITESTRDGFIIALSHEGVLNTLATSLPSSKDGVEIGILDPENGLDGEQYSHSVFAKMNNIWLRTDTEIEDFFKEADPTIRRLLDTRRVPTMSDITTMALNWADDSDWTIVMRVLDAVQASESPIKSDDLPGMIETAIQNNSPRAARLFWDLGGQEFCEKLLKGWKSERQLYFGILINDRDIVQRAIDAGANLHNNFCFTDCRETPLFTALGYEIDRYEMAGVISIPYQPDDSGIIRLLIKSGAPTDERDSRGYYLSDKCSSADLTNLIRSEILLARKQVKKPRIVAT